MSVFFASREKGIAWVLFYIHSCGWAEKIHNFTRMIDWKMTLKNKINNKVLKIILSDLLGLVWVFLIVMHQEEELTIGVGTTLYYFPFYFLGTYIFDYLLSTRMIAFLNNFFENEKVIFINSLVLLVLLIIPYNIHFEHITLFSFLINLSSFIFSNLFYQIYFRSRR